MAAQGTLLKQTITDKLLEAFPSSFINGKEIRICGIENGAEVQVKVTLTTAKTNVEHPDGDMDIVPIASDPTTTIGSANNSTQTEPTAEEKAKVSDFLAKLGF